MATFTYTFAAGGGQEAGAVLRRMSEAIAQAAGDLPDKTTAAVTLTLDNAPSTGVGTAQITAGPFGAGTIVRF